MINKIKNKLTSNLQIYKTDIKKKGLYWSIVHRLYKLYLLKTLLTPLVNYTKPDFIIHEGNKLYIDKWDDAISQELLQSKQWEKYETKVFRDNIKKGDIVVDIGAHIGYYTLIAAKSVGTKGKVYAFEPDKKNYTILLKNISSNGFKNIIPINKAITAKSGKLKLFINSKNTGDHRIYDSLDNRNFVEIESVSLDDYFKNKSLNFIKMDIQGSEVGALLGASLILKNNKSIKLITEFWPGGLQLNGEHPKNLLTILKRNQFTLYDIDEAKERHTIIDEEELLYKYQTTFDDFTNLLCMR